MEVKLTEINVSNALDELAEWFPDQAAEIELHKQELIEHIVNQSTPAANSRIGRMRYRSMPLTMTEVMKEEPLFTPCQSAIAGSLMNAGIFVVGLIGLRVSYTSNAARAMERTLGKTTLNGFNTMLKNFADAKDKFQAARGLWDIAGSLWQASGFKVVLAVWKDQASWFDFILTGVTMIAQLFIWFASDGLAFIAMVVLTILSAFTLIQSIKNAVDTCSSSHIPPSVTVALDFTPLGSYHFTSSNIKVMMTAQCKDVKQKYLDAKATITKLPTNVLFENINGVLESRGVGSLIANKFTPLGSYSQTSRNIKVVLYADCLNAKGTPVKSEIDITNFSTSQTIDNMNGKLTKSK